MEHNEQKRIVATRVPDGKRIGFFPRYFGRHMLLVENYVYAHLSRLCADYRGGLWDYVDLSNGGCYITPSAPRGYTIVVDGNGFTGRLDAECAGVVATLFALSHLSMRFPGVETFARRFHQLRDFACEHPDGNLVLAAID